MGAIESLMVGALMCLAGGIMGNALTNPDGKKRLDRAWVLAMSFAFALMVVATICHEMGWIHIPSRGTT